MKSLIQQRFAINRQRYVAIAFIVLGALEVGLGITRIFLQSKPEGSWVFFGVLGVGYVATGVINLRQARRTRTAFESEHGSTAGKQQSE